MTKIEIEEEFAKRYKSKPVILTKEEFINRLKESIMNKKEETSGIEAVVTYTELIDKIDLVLKNQEVIMDLLSRKNKISQQDTKSVSRRVYKELVSGAKIQVGWVLPFSSILEFNIPNDIYIKTPNSYYPEWYVEEVTDNGRTFNFFKPSNDIIEIVNKNKKSYCVTGFILEDGRAIYYDQYL